MHFASSDPQLLAHIAVYKWPNFLPHDSAAAEPSRIAAPVGFANGITTRCWAGRPLYANRDISQRNSDGKLPKSGKFLVPGFNRQNPVNGPGEQRIIGARRGASTPFAKNYEILFDLETAPDLFQA